MKKLFVAALSLTLFSVLLAGCGAEETTPVEKSYTAEAQVTSILLDVKDRSIEITPSPDGQIHLTYAETNLEFYTLIVEEDTLVLRSESDKTWKDYIGVSSPAGLGAISLQIPPEGLDSLELSTTNHDVSLPALSCSGRVSVKVNKGNITFDALDAGTAIALEAKDGDVTGTVAGSYDDFSIATQTKKGTCNLPQSKEGGEKSLDVTVNNGDVNVNFASPTL